MIDSNETLTYFNTSNDSTLYYVDENGDTTFVNVKALIDSSETVTVFDNLNDSTLYYVDENGDSTFVDIKQLAVTESLTYFNTSNDSIVYYVDENGDTTFVNVKALIDSSETVTFFNQLNDSVLYYVNEDRDTTKVDITDMVDSLETLTVISNTDSTISYLDENGNTTILDVKSMVVATSDTLYSIITDSTLQDSVFIVKLDSVLRLYGDTVYFNDTTYALISDSLLNDTLWIDSLGKLLNDNDWNINANGTGLEAAAAANNFAGGDYAIAGGYQDTANGFGAVVAGGYLNKTSDNYTVVGGGLQNTARANSATVGGGYLNNATATSSTVGGGQANNATANSSTVSGGITNTANSSAATVGGGQTNIASGDWSTVSGGRTNVTSGNYATISGGHINTASGIQSFIGGGANNTTSNSNSVVVGGNDNTASGLRSSLVGGEQNSAIGNYSVVSGGQGDTASGLYSVVGGGDENKALGSNSTVGGGSYNSAVDASSTVSGGTSNIASGVRSTVSGGILNLSSANSSVVSGGRNDTASGDYSTVSGGIYNKAYGNNSTVGGGVSNTATTDATVGGGNQNNASGGYATIGGGTLNTASLGSSTVSGGASNNASAIFSTVGGGNRDTASGGYSVVSGGIANTAQGAQSSVGGGNNNNAIGESSTISGGLNNEAIGSTSTISGGDNNTTVDAFSTVSGGQNDTAFGIYSTVSGGRRNKTRSSYSVVGGGVDNAATSTGATVSGGDANTASGIRSTVSGGNRDTASGDYSVVSGGEENKASGENSIVSGGYENKAVGDYTTVSGGRENTAHSYGEWAGGLYGTNYVPASTTTFNTTDRLFNIGNGTSTALRSDAFTILKNGNTGIGINTPTNQLHIAGGTNPIRAIGIQPATSNDSSLLVIDPIDGTFRHLDMDSLQNRMSDHDWYEVGTTTAPNSINDNAYTFGRVGIGTNTPLQSLHVRLTSVPNFVPDGLSTQIIESTDARLEIASSDAANNASALILSNTVGAGDIRKWTIGSGTSSPSNDDKLFIGFYKATTNLPNYSSYADLTIDTLGQLGIGTTSPTNQLHIAGGINPIRLEGLQPTIANDTSILITDPSTGVVRYINIDSLQSQISDHDWYEVGTITAPNSINDTMYTLGNVGIGIITPTEKLHLLNDTGDTRIRIEADPANLNEEWNPAITFHQDGGINNSYVGYYDAGIALTNPVVGTGANNSLLLLNNGGSNSIDFGIDDTIAMTVTDNRNVGIGISSPIDKLHVYGGRGIFGTTNTQQAMIGADGSNVAYSGSNTNHPYQLRVNNTTRMHIATNGDVGIGTATPTHRLDVVGEARVRTINDTANATGVLTANAAGVVQNLPIDSLIKQTADHDWYEVGTTTAPNSITDTVYTLGNVGIGTTSAATYPLNVYSNSTNAQLNVQGATSSIYMGGDWGVGYTSATDLRIKTNNITRVTVDAAGNTGIGTTTPQSLLHLQRDGAALTFQTSANNIAEGGTISFVEGNFAQKNFEIKYNGTTSGSTGERLYFVSERLAPSVTDTIMTMSRFNSAVGIGQISPTTALHISPNIVGQEPLRLDSLQVANASDTAVLVVDPTNGTVRYMDLDSIIAPNLYSDNGTIASNRTVNGNDNDLTINNVNELTIDADTLILNNIDTLAATTGYEMLVKETATGIVRSIRPAKEKQTGITISTITLANTPVATQFVDLYMNGQLLTEGATDDYTIVGGTITLTFTPLAGDVFIIKYSY
jgi:hypothetical protein